MKILISAAEASSDAHGAELLKALRFSSPQNSIDAYGIGGPKLRAAGLRGIVDARELLSMGFIEVLARLPRIFRALNLIESAAVRDRPDVAVVIDYPEFHILLAKRLKRLGIPVIYYIPPKVWVWRKGRIAKLKKYFAKLICIFPFEVPFYENENISITYVGNPLIDELPMKMTRAEARLKLGLDKSAKTVVIMPGSRPAELKQHLDVMLSSAVRAAAKLRSSGVLGAKERLCVLVPFSVTADLVVLRERVQSWLNRASGQTARLGETEKFILDIRVFQGSAPECMVAAEAGLIKSGNSTLEAGLLGCPHSVVFRPNWVTTLIFRYLIRYRGPVGLVNLVAGSVKPYMVNEILCEQVSEHSLCDEWITLLTDSAARSRLSEGFSQLRKQMMHFTESPSRLAAEQVIETARSANSL